MARNQVSGLGTSNPSRNNCVNGRIPLWRGHWSNLRISHYASRSFWNCLTFRTFCDDLLNGVVILTSLAMFVRDSSWGCCRLDVLLDLFSQHHSVTKLVVGCRWSWAVLYFTSEILFKSPRLTHGINLLLDDWFADWALVRCLVSYFTWVQLTTVLVPVYVSETAPRQIRGSLVATYQLFVTMGILTSYCINLGTSQVQNQSGSWRGALACTYLWAGLLAIGYVIQPTS
jgi:MFS family permease